jgi:hypothetical protein
MVREQSIMGYALPSVRTAGIDSCQVKTNDFKFSHSIAGDLGCQTICSIISWNSQFGVRRNVLQKTWSRVREFDDYADSARMQLVMESAIF